MTAIEGGMLLTKLITYTVLRGRDHALPLFLCVESWLAGHIMKPILDWIPNQGKYTRLGVFLQRLFSAECILLRNVHNKINSLINLHAQRNAAG